MAARKTTTSKSTAGTARKTAGGNNKPAARGRKKTASLSLSEDRVRETAYYIWESKGCPADSDMDDWLEAERQLRA